MLSAACVAPSVSIQTVSMHKRKSSISNRQHEDHRLLGLIKQIWLESI
jgi:hypothetical protein